MQTHTCNNILAGKVNCGGGVLNHDAGVLRLQREDVLPCWCPFQLEEVLPIAGLVRGGPVDLAQGGSMEHAARPV